MDATPGISRQTAQAIRKAPYGLTAARNWSSGVSGHRPLSFTTTFCLGTITW